MNTQGNGIMISLETERDSGIIVVAAFFSLSILQEIKI
jgi:hypothetical protein